MYLINEKTKSLWEADEDTKVSKLPKDIRKATDKEVSDWGDQVKEFGVLEEKAKTLMSKLVENQIKALG